MTKSILIVDDNYDDRTLMQHIIKHLTSHDYTAVKDDVEALDRLQISHYDLIILDVRLRDAWGWDVIDRLRNTEVYAHTPIMAVTAYDRNASQQKTLEAGCDIYMTKPLDIDHFAHTINHLLYPSPFS